MHDHARRLVSLALFIVLTLLLSVAAHAQAPYTNPVIAKPGTGAEVADPYVLKWNGEYYLYTSGDPITAYHSEDLVNWRYIGPVLSSSKADGAWNGADLWAPEVVYRNGKFLMYYTATVRSKDWLTQELARRVGVAVSDRPEGPFVDIGRAVTPGWAIDGNVFLDPATGKEYLFYSHLDEAKLKGAALVADRMRAWNAVEGKPSLITHGTEAWEDKDGDQHNGSLRYTNEAPTVIEHNGKYYMMYSGGSWDLPTYSLAYAMSDKLPEGGLEGAGWTKITPPVVRSTPLVDAPGHNSVVKAPNNVDDINVYHARVIPFIEPWNRMPFVDRLYWNHDRMWAPQPSTGAMTPPDKPLFADNFNRANGAPGVAWRGAGDWRIADRQLVGTAKATRATAALVNAMLTYYVFEANVRVINGTAGIVAAERAREDRVELLIDPTRKALVVRESRGGSLWPDKTVPLPQGFDPAVYHQFLLTRNGENISLRLDGQVMYAANIAQLSPTFPSLLVESGTAAFDGVALTTYYEDTFDTPAPAWSERGGNWVVAGGALQQTDVTAVNTSAGKGETLESFEFQASVRLREGDSKDARVGIAVNAPEKIVAAFDKNIWPHARFHVTRYQGEKPVQSYAMPMPRGFRYDEFHTIRVVKFGDAFTFYLDGAEIAAHRFPIGVARPGLFTNAASADFDNARYKRVVVEPNLLLNGSFETEQWDAAKPVQGNPWTVAGNAREHYCCAHTGLRKLLFQPGLGTARQVLPADRGGKYTLDGWAIGGAGGVTVRVLEGGKQIAATRVTGDAWKRFSVPFTLATKSTVEVVVSASPATGASATVDDLYLSREQ